MRYGILDGFRGFFILFMMIVHADEILGTVLGMLNHHSFGWVEDAQGFVFISGLVVGLVYGGVLDRKGYPATRLAMNKRCLTIYKYHAGLTLLICAAALSIGGTHPGVVRYIAHPVETVFGSLALFSVTNTMGILPMYLFFMLATPWVLQAIKAGYLPAVAFVSASLWLFSQTYIPREIGIALEAQLAAAGYQLPIGLGFNVFGWQAVFFIGLIPGCLLAEGKLYLGFLKGKQYEATFYVALVVIFLLGILDRVVWWKLISKDYTTAFLAANGRSEFSALYLLAFLLDLFAMTWLLVAGPTSNFRLTRQASAAAHWLFSRRPLVFLGQHSLQVFSWHVVVVYALMLFARKGGYGEAVDTAIILGAVVSLFIPASIHAWYVKKANARKAVQLQPA